ncbi:hypothetical protein HPP92_026738 [Vanilla planifolia]|uniref:Nicastrin n=1 Tax=Vanilla planifolia TaxID=51239 RepID=A0A835PD79_VANPL|nr:hypothetical protein HPP92_026738 [Vanilla planifolia]
MFPSVDRPLVLVSILLAIGSFFFAVGDASTLESIPSLEKEMYLIVDGYPCVRLLNLSGEIGCSNPGENKIVAPVFRLERVYKQIGHSSAVLVPLHEMEDFFLRHDSLFPCIELDSPLNSCIIF